MTKLALQVFEAQDQVGRGEKVQLGFRAGNGRLRNDIG